MAAVEGKIRNQANLLKYLSKNRKEKQPDIYEAVRLLADEVQDHLDELDRVVNKVAVPLSYADELYALRNNIYVVRKRVLAVAAPPAEAAMPSSRSA